MNAIEQATNALTQIAAIASYTPMQEGTQTAGEMGRDSYATPCVPMNSADEAWEQYAEEHGIGKGRL